ncbi:SSU-1 protein [Aphelenchoides avenae]|nr:SSU-1 protein [Aphelenchus avenae]
MIRDLVGVVTKIATFLGGSAAAIVHDPVRVAEIVKWSSFDTMNQAPTVWFPEQHMHKLEFLRKGTTRDWVSHMTKRQSDLVDKHHRSMVAGTVAESWWHTEMAYSAQQGNLK